MKPKNLLLASAHTGMGELLTPVMAQAVISFLLAPSPTVRVVSFSARALPPGSSASVLSGLASSASSSHAVVSMGPPKEE